MGQSLTASEVEPLVAVIIPALNEAGKIGRLPDKMPRDGRFEAIVGDDGGRALGTRSYLRAAVVSGVSR